jgi:hypothetical protein
VYFANATESGCGQELLFSTRPRSIGLIGFYLGFGLIGSPRIRNELVNTGAFYENADVVVSHHVSSRRPNDLPAFCRELISRLE